MDIISVYFFSIEGQSSENVRWPGGKYLKVSKSMLSVTSFG